MGGGYIKIHRKLLDWQWHDIPEMVSVWMHMLLDTSYEQSEWRGVVRERGQLTIGLREYAKRCGVSIQCLRTCLQRLKSTNEITTTSTNHYTLVTITQYDSYQSFDKESTNGITNGVTNEQQTDNKPTTNQQHISKKVKNLKTKEDIKWVQFENEKLNNTFKAFLQMRKSIKKQPTENAIALLIKDMNKISTDTDTQIKMLENAITHNWLTVYPLPKQEKPNGGYEDWTGTGSKKSIPKRDNFEQREYPDEFFEGIANASLKNKVNP